MPVRIVNTFNTVVEGAWLTFSAKKVLVSFIWRKKIRRLGMLDYM